MTFQQAAGLSGQTPFCTRWHFEPAFAWANFFEGLGTDTVDLGHALHVLMNHPNAIQSYMEGKNLFVESVSSSETEALDFGQIASTNGPAYVPPLEGSAPSGNLLAPETSHLNQRTREYLQTGDFTTYLHSIAGSSVGRKDGKDHCS